MDDFWPFTAQNQPTARRPLLGLTVLVVEDSRFACDALRLLCLRSGARIRRADCLASARRHLQIYRPSVVIADMGLPDGSGADLIEELNRASPRVGVLLAISGDSFAEDSAIAAGADGFLQKPLANLATFQEAILSRLPADRQPAGPRVLPDGDVRPDPIAYRDDLCHAADTLCQNADDPTLAYVGQFLSGIARSAGDRALAEAADTVAALNHGKRPLNADIVRLNLMLKDRISETETV